MDGDLGDLGVLLKAAILAGEEIHLGFEAEGKEWIVSMKPTKELPTWN